MANLILSENMDQMIVDQINKNLIDTATVTKKKEYTFVEEIHSSTNTRRIANDQFSFESVSLGNLTDSEINTMAKEIYNITQVKTTSAADSTKEDSYSTVSKLFEDTKAGKFFTGVQNVTNIISEAFGKGTSELDAITNDWADTLGSFGQYLANDKGTNSFMAALGGIASVIADGLKTYQDGVSETSFGTRMDNSWYGSDNEAFLNYFKKQNKAVSLESRKINILQSTPLDSGETRESLYGSLMLGTPFLFNEYSDPTNRTLINSLIKDGRFVSFTPGLPKFNGTSYTATAKNNILNQTKTPTSMLEYLTKNGLDRDFADKDKRYYTFKTDYKDYFAYLETMLNVVWIKMGLAKNGETFNLFTFFNIKGQDSDGGIIPDNFESLIEKYNSSIGFFTNVSNAVSESISSSPSSDGDELASRANQNAQEYQRMNYITGMGTGSSFDNATRKIGIGLKSASQLKTLLGDSLSGTINAIQGVSNNGGGFLGVAKTVLQVAKIPIALASDIVTFNNTNDLGSIIQSFATSNGMLVKYPNLWADSSYSKNINFNFSFVSPYGDPLSIFKYVYVPFFALLAFAMPRQAAENGLVSPFLIRCDVPGVVTSDLALISDMTWTKGGANALWTKDGLPRAIDVTITVSDLYPFLAMSKRISFLSANPSFAVFLDNMSGMLALNDSKEDDGLNAYFKEMVNRVNGESENGTNMWNKFNSSKSKAVREMADRVRSSVSASVDPHAVPWLHNSSIT